MLPGGTVPVAQLVAMIRNSQPRSAAGLLMALPAERLPVVTAALRPADLVRIVPALKPPARQRLVQALGDEQLLEVVRGAPIEQATPLEAVTWVDGRHDGQLMRALVSLFQ
jgi:Mg/Co/Ni transporter MgtE